MPSSLRDRLVGLAFVLLVASPTAAAAGKDEPVDLELIIGVDVSWSVDAAEAKLQRDGYVAAFSDEKVVDAIKSGFLGKVAVLYFEWAGYGHSKVVSDWTLLEDGASARAFAAKLAKVPLETARRTSISQAIDWAVPQFDQNRFAGRRRVIDISGDGPNNWGRLVNLARDDAVAAGVTINGLPIVNGEPEYPSRWWLPNLDLYYENCVIGGRGAFAVVATGFKDFAEAVKRKLVLEIAGRQPESRFAGKSAVLGKRMELAMADTVGAAPSPQGGRMLRLVERAVPPCDVGERRRRGFFTNP